MLLALLALAVGVNPITVVADFLADATIQLSEPALRLVVVWFSYGLLYSLLMLDMRAIRRMSAHDRIALADVLTGISRCPLARLLIGAVNSGLRSIILLARRVVLGSGWLPGNHPQLE